jgi:DNA-binding NarL/FixJ family response regulator
MAKLEEVRGASGSTYIRGRLWTSLKGSEAKRVMQLHREGLENWQIAERRGLSEDQVAYMIQKVRRRTRRK